MVCRACHRSSVFVLAQTENHERVKAIFKMQNELVSGNGSLNDIARFVAVVSKLNFQSREVPDHLPQPIENAMQEASRCMVAQCWNASAAMFRLALDLATKSLLPEEGEPSASVRRNLGLRLRWLFENSKLPVDLQDLSECIQKDGNDGAHDGNLTEQVAEDLHDFAFELLRRIYTEPKRIELAKERRVRRRQFREAE